MKSRNGVTRFAWAFGLLLAAPSAMADWSVELGAGIFTADTDTTQEELEDKGYTLNRYDADDQAAIAQLRFGYQVLPYWQVQVGYVYMDDLDSSVDANLVTTEAQLTQDFADAQVVSSSGLLVQLTGDIPVSQASSIRIGIGAFSWETEQKVRANLARRTVDEEGTTGTIELGYNYAITQNIRVGASWQWFKVRDEDLNAFQARVSYHFGH